jgi:hypothetical protein
VAFVAVGQAHGGVRQALAEGAQDARLADAGVAHQQGGVPLGDGLGEVVEDRALGGGDKEILGRDLLAERGLREAEVTEFLRFHESWSSSSCARRMASTISLRRALLGSKPVFLASDAGLRVLRVSPLAMGSTGLNT